MMEIADNPPECTTDVATVSQQDTHPTDLEMKLLFEKLSLARTKPKSMKKLPENNTFVKSQRPRHTNILEVTDSGASPDGMIDCFCCGKGVLEIKCPYLHQNETVESAASNNPSFCLKKDKDLLYLDHTHDYYYQVQIQMFVCNVEYCDFCVCTFPESNECSPYVE